MKNFFLKLLDGELPEPGTYEVKEDLIAMQKMQNLNKTRQIPNLESQPDQSNKGKANIGNGTENFSAFNGNFDTRKAVALVSGIKAELEKAGLLTTPEAQDKVLQLEKLAQILQIGFAAAEQSFKSERQRLLAIVSHMRQASDIDTLLKATVTEIREHLQVDRALIYRFQVKDQGIVLTESMVGGYTPSQGETLAVQIFGGENGAVYQQQQMVALEDIYQKNLSPYQLQLLERFQIKASLSLPIVIEGQVWGLLVVQQCSSPRQWQETEISLLYQIVTELTLSLQPAAFRAQMQRQVEQQKVLAKVIEKIQQSPDINTIFRTATQELRQLLKADRVVIYRFNPDWSGEFVAESVGPGWVAVLKEQEQEPILKGDRVSFDRCNVKNLAAPSTADADTYLGTVQKQVILGNKAGEI